MTPAAACVSPRVVMVMIVVTAEPFGVTEPGLKVQVAKRGRPEHVKVTALLKPERGDMANCIVPDCPARTLISAAATLTV